MLTATDGWCYFSPSSAFCALPSAVAVHTTQRVYSDDCVTTGITPTTRSAPGVGWTGLSGPVQRSEASVAGS